MPSALGDGSKPRNWRLRDAIIALTPNKQTASQRKIHQESRFVAVGTPVARRSPPRSVRAELLHTAPTSDAWRRSAGWDEGGGFWHSESTDRPTARTAPMSSGHVGSAAPARGTSARLPGPESCSDYPCCRALRDS